MTRWRTTLVVLPRTVQLQKYEDGTFTGGSAAMVRGRHFHERFNWKGTGTVLPHKVVGRCHRDEELELVDHPLS